MLYLAELNKPSFGRVSLQLLAKQQQQDNWQAVNEEAVALEGKAAQDANRIKDGAMVLAEINNTRQVLQLREAAKQLVAYLQSYARLQEKARSQEEEVEVWKQSLSFQHKALQERELELNQRQEELENISAEYRKYSEELRTLGARQEEIQAREANIAEQQQAVRQQRELLSRQQQELEALLANAQSSRIGDQEANELRSLIAQIMVYWETDPDPGSLVEPLQQTLTQRQQDLDQVSAQLAQERAQAQQRQDELDRSLQLTHKRRQEWFKARNALDSAWMELKIQETLRKSRQEQTQKLAQQLQVQAEIHRFAYGLVGQYDFISASGLATRQAEELDISVEELQEQVDHLRREFQQRSVQVNQQVTEFEQTQQNLLELQRQLETADPDERMDIEMDIDYTQSACSALEEALSPQRERLQREQEELIRQEALLQKLKEKTQEVPTSKTPLVDIGPLLAQLEEQKQFQQEEKERLDKQIQQFDAVLWSQQDALAVQRSEIENQWKQLEQEENTIRINLQGMAETWGRLNFRQSELTHEFERLNAVRSQVEKLRGVLAQRYAQGESCGSQVKAVQSILNSFIQP